MSLAQRVALLRHSTLARKASVATLDQVVVSVTNLAVGVLVIRSSSAEEYGLFVFANAVLLLGMAVHAAVVTTPMTVALPSRAAEGRPGFPGLVLAVQLVCVAALTAAVDGAIRVADLPSDYSGLLRIAALALNGVLLKEFVRAWLYTRLLAGAVLAVDVCQGLLLCGYLSLQGRHGPSSGAEAMWAIGIVSVIVSIGALALLLLRADVRVVRDAGLFSEIGRIGRWSLAGAVVTWCQTQSYVYLLHLLVGPVGTALASAARLLFSPLALVASGWGVVLRPWGAGLADARPALLVSAVRSVTMVLLLLAVPYGVLLTAAYPALAASLLADDYAGLPRSMLLLWTAYFCVLVVRGSVTTMLQAARDFRALTTLAVVGAVATIGSSWPLIAAFGTNGSIAGLVAGELCLCLLALRRLRAITGRAVATATAAMAPS